VSLTSLGSEGGEADSRRTSVGRLLARAAAEQALLSAWEEVRESAYEDGEPGAAVTAFERQALSRLTELAGEVATGEYRPKPMTGVTISKPGGGIRELAVGAVEDRIVERAVLAVLDRLIDPLLSPWSFAYRRGLGVKDAVRALAEARDAGLPWAVRTDFEECFASIPRWPVLVKLREVVPDAELVALVQALMGRPVIGSRDRRGLGLHEGSALSPILSNLYLDEFDRVLIGQGFQVIRYGDDIAIPVIDRPTGERVLELATAAAKPLRLRLEETKSRVAAYDDGVPFLGQMVTATTGAGPDPQAHPLRGTVFVTTEGALLRTRGERLRVEKDEELLASIALKRVRQIVCEGRVGVTSTLLHRALEAGIHLVWLHHDGRYAGRLTPLTGGDAGLRLAQYEAVRDQEAALGVARRIVAGKITNMRAGLLRAARAQELPDVDVVAKRLGASRVGALTADSNTQLMGIEGAATRDYFGALAQIIGPDWGFESRQRRPPGSRSKRRTRLPSPPARPTPASSPTPASPQSQRPADHRSAGRRAARGEGPLSSRKGKGPARSLRLSRPPGRAGPMPDGNTMDLRPEMSIGELLGRPGVCLHWRVTWASPTSRVGKRCGDWWVSSL
jgi:CRISPR-associated protein Cas1